MQLEEQVLEGKGRYKIFVMNIQGLIVGGSSSSGPLRSGAAETSANAFEILAHKIRNDPSTRGVMVRINSGGGMASASEILYDELSLIRSRGIPVAAHMTNVGASGAYMAACGAQWIMAHPATWVGSIGVILQKFDVSEALAKLGIKTETLTTSPFKDAGSMYKPLTPEQKKYLKGLIEDTLQRFIHIVFANRPIEETNIAEVTSAKIFTASQAKALGLIDEIGTYYQAKAALLQEIVLNNRGVSIDQYRWTRFVPKQSALSNMLGTLGMRHSILPEIDRLSFLLDNPGPWYLWRP